MSAPKSDLIEAWRLHCATCNERALSMFETFVAGFKAGRAAESEACAKVAEKASDNYEGAAIATAIRARGQGCANCGDTGIHACIGHKPEPMTDEERAGLQKAVEAVFRDRPDYFRKPRSEYGGTCADLPSKIRVPNASDVVGD